MNDINKYREMMKPSDMDDLAVIVKGIVGPIPYFGPMLAEALSSQIPNQRFDRLIKYIEILTEKLTNLQLSIDDHRLRLEKIECIDILHEGYIQANRALTNERRCSIATIVVSAYSSNEHFPKYKYILRFIQELNDEELIFLRYYLHPLPEIDDEFRQKNADILKLDEKNAKNNIEDIEKYTIKKSYTQHLERLGLIETERIIHGGNFDIPQFEENENIEYSITNLGKIVLKCLGYDVTYNTTENISLDDI